MPNPQSDTSHTPSVVYLTAFWSNAKESNAAGQETLPVSLSNPLLDVLERRKKVPTRHLHKFRIAAADHLVLKTEGITQDAAHNLILAAARVLRFMAETGLRPSVHPGQLRRMQDVGRPPGHDHPSYWQDPETGTWVLLEEPYAKVLPPCGDWARQRGLHLVAPSWQGLYAPGATSPFLVCEAAAVAQRLAVCLPHLQGLPPLSGVGPEWTGESSTPRAPFISPARLAALRSNLAIKASSPAACAG